LISEQQVKIERYTVNNMDDKTPDADRLGFLYGLPGVDAENVALFAKITRILGLLIVVSFVLWGMFY